ncbi:MAG: ABC transporter ATP-binding protein/permease, partial [Clostridia bacterium]|nr:ABC transporter ATP-binding protein/permease [Clostridia bacterium]
MLNLKHISKTYKTGQLVQKALDDVSLTFRDNEFVAVLGPSGSGKTTLLNIVGGLDRYDTGDLVIDNVSTKEYRDRDWDSYRNHSVGFVFQSYNLIEHQSILANVELALTISGIRRKERRQRAKDALTRVGLGDQIHKKPNQLSGGQMQRVAIARALVNNPRILLADEPTGALDTETSVQVMELLKEVARDRLVVMVTHNPDLARDYASRTVTLRDGKITSDSNPVEKTEETAARHKNFGRASMSFFTALSLSFNNLLTKKARTVLTSFAGSIGIIGIALILALSTGVNNYIDSIQKDTMTSYPITIQAESLDLSTIFKAGADSVADTSTDHALDKIYSNTDGFEIASLASTSLTKNNLTEFKKYLEDKNSDIQKFIGENGVVYTYKTKFSLYTYDSDDFLVNTDGSTLSDKQSMTGTIIGNMSQMMSGMGSGASSSALSFSTGNMTGMSAPVTEQLLPTRDGTGISPVVKENYTLIEGGRWPEQYNELVLVVDENREIAAATLYRLGFLPTSEYRKLIAQVEKGEKLDLKADSFTYDEIYNKEFMLLAACDFYQENEDGNFENALDSVEKLDALLKNAVKVHVTGIVYPSGDQSFISAPLGYTQALTDYLISHTEESAVVLAQSQNSEKNVLNGMEFEPEDDAQKVADTITYLSGLGVSEKAKFFDQLTSLAAMQGALGSVPTMGGMSQMTGTSTALGETQKAAMLDAYLAQPKDEELLKIYDLYISSGSYEDNMSAFGLVSLDAPESVSIYVDTFENKDEVSRCIEGYNSRAKEENKISYVDFVGLLMSSMTTIIDVISYVLIAFVSVSLVVSSIMIGIITYISVLERTKEIGILRAIGASKRNISRVFNAETFMIGLLSGVFGVGVTWLATIPINSLIHFLTGTTSINAVLPLPAAVILVILSMVLTV